VLTGALGLRDAVGSFREAAGFGNKIRVHEVPFEDWTLDGRLLRDVIRDAVAEQMAAPGGEVTLLSDRWVAPAPVEALERLLAGRPGDFEDGPIALYVCQVDADPGCATMSADVVIGSDTVEWRNLGWQVNYQPGVAGADPPLSIAFRRSDYEAILREALARWRDRSAQDSAE
jgi:hypothetical protein